MFARRKKKLKKEKMDSIFVALGVSTNEVTFTEVSPTVKSMQKREFNELRRSTRLSQESLANRTTSGKHFAASPKSFKHNSERTSRGKTTDAKYNFDKAKGIRKASKKSTKSPKDKA